MLPYEDARSLALLYHLNSEPWMNLTAYSTYPGAMAFKSVGAGEDTVSLPPPDESSLLRLLAARRSCRQFAPIAVPVANLSSLLHAGYGTLGLRDYEDGMRKLHRPVPSAGCLYPLELYVVVNAVEALRPGIYHFHARRQQLEPVARDVSPRDLVPALMSQAFLETAPVIVLIASVFERTLRKYGPRGYRYVLFEAGQVAQNICLLASELGLGTVCIGGFVDHALNDWLRLDGVEEAALYGIAVGTPA